MIWVWDEILPSYIGGIIWKPLFSLYIRIPTKQPVFLSLAHVILPQNGWTLNSPQETKGSLLDVQTVYEKLDGCKKGASLVIRYQAGK